MSFYFAPKMHPNNWTSPVVQYLNLFFRNKSVNSKIVSWKISATGSHIFQRGNLCFCFPSVFLPLGEPTLSNISFGGFRVRWGLVPGVWQLFIPAISPPEAETSWGPTEVRACIITAMALSSVTPQSFRKRVKIGSQRSVTVSMGKQQQQEQRKKKNALRSFELCEKWGIFWLFLLDLFGMKYGEPSYV